MQISFWEEDALLQPSDVLIIGAGFSGLWLSYFLKKQHPTLHIRLIDKSPIPQGASTKNAGFACFGSPSELMANVATMGRTAALQWAATRLEGIQIIEKEAGNAADFSLCGGYEVYKTAEDFEQQCRFLPELNTFFSDYLQQPEPIYQDATAAAASFGFQGFPYLIKNRLEGSLHPVKLWRFLYEKVQQMGVQVQLGVSVEKLVELPTAVEVATPVGILRANKVVLTMNAFTPDLLPDFDSRPGRGQVLLTSPLKNLPFEGTFHFNEGFYYFRNVGNRVLLGGGRELDFEAETTHEFAVTPHLQQVLEQYLKEHILPNQTYEITHRWAGIMAFDDTKLPIAEWKTKRLGICGRFNGMGVALAPALARRFAQTF